jgi:hypothetical protein
VFATLRYVSHVVGTIAWFVLDAPILSCVSGSPTTPPAIGAAEGQFKATNVCQPKFHQSVWEGVVLATSTGTTHELAGKTVATSFFSTLLELLLESPHPIHAAVYVSRIAPQRHFVMLVIEPSSEAGHLSNQVFTCAPMY